ncbi:NHS-like protein 1 isoform X3 [Rhineura floridana]|uniref:NHS-like protein 1 isoform X3 n=1 Tax=Rhineura floridana TaxID=261503 RepID=UPI002AC84B39|nr:NHS-like protein 1 isoform X3 [Rhineura floridana]
MILSRGDGLWMKAVSLGSLSRAVSWINFSTLSKQTKRLFRSDGELTSICGQQMEEDESWTYRPQHRNAVSNLDEESRWTVHYTAPWHQQENVFLPATRPPCVEDLHRQAKLNLKSVLRECDKLRRDGYRSSQYYSQGPTFSASSSVICGNYQGDYEEIEQKCSTPSPEEEKLISIKQPKTPVSNEFSDINTQTNWTKSLPLPTPEEKMRQQAQTVQTDVIPINVTGENFDRQASIRRSLIYTDTVVRRPKKVKRRKTITGVPDNIQRELVGNGKNDFRGHSLCVPDHYSTLGRLDSYHSSVQQSDTKDSGCQTEEVKVVPPSVRRIRAQKGQGIAAQMSQLSSSSGNMSVMSDSAGVVFVSRLNNDLGFHSLPRSGARVSLQLLERRHSLSKSTEDRALSHQISKLQVDDNIGHMRNNGRTGVLQRPKSQEVKNSENGQEESLACIVSPNATYSTNIIPNATLSSSSEVIVIHTTQGAGAIDSKITNFSSYTKPRDNRLANNMVGTKDQYNSSSSIWNETSPTHHSQSLDDTVSSNAVIVLALGDSGVSLSGARTVEKGHQNMTYSSRSNLSFPTRSQDSNSRSESNYHVDKTQVRVQKSTEHCGLKCSGNEEMLFNAHKPDCVTPGCSTPVSNLSTSSLERVSAKEDSSSLYSVDHDGYYTSMHMDSGLKSCNNNNGFGNARHSILNAVDGIEKKSLGDLSNCSDKSLSRSISLKKAKKPPLPPSRTDSLRRIPKKKMQSNGQVLDDMLIASLQHSLQLNLKSKNGSLPSQSPCSDYDDPWVQRSRSQSSVSASSSMMSATAMSMYTICTVTPSQSETSSIKSEYADQWGYYSDYSGTPDVQLKSPVVHSANSEPKLNDYNISCLNDGSRASTQHVPSGLAKPKITSPEKPHRVTSPSSGYSSQSNTPTALTPVPVILQPVSTGNGKPKMKPKVPERKSSLLSSVSMSSSSTSLSSNTSAEGNSVKKSDPVPSFPLDISSPLMCPDSAEYVLPPPPPPLTDVTELPPSPSFPPPPPEAVINASFPQSVPLFNDLAQDTLLNHFCPSSPSIPSPPLPPPFPSSFPPLAPPLDPKLTKDVYKNAPYSFKKYNQEDSSHSTIKGAFKKEDPARPTMPLVTTQALQMVQLRSVRKAVMSEVEQPVESPSPTNTQEKLTDVFSACSHLKPCVSGHSDSVVEGEVKPHGAFDKTYVYTPNQRSYPGLCGNSDFTSGTVPGNTANLANSFASDLPPASVEEAPVQNQGSGSDFASSSLQGQSECLNKLQGVLPNKKPPPVSKKPKLFLIVPPPQPDVTAEKIAEVGETVRITPSVTTRDAAIAQYSQTKDYPTDGLCSYEMDSGCLVPEGGAVCSTSCETLEVSVSTLQPKQEEQSCLCEGSSSNSIGDSISAADRHPSQGDESTEVFESDVQNSFLLQNPSYEEGSEAVAMPARPRTTEDLFAAIHRSKRKVLGRKDSEDDRTRNHSPSPPVTPTGASPNLASLKHAGSIQRNIRKSSTSNDNFKALLLKKGSRSDTSSRMSAAEMLKNTDPRFQRAKVDSPWDPTDSTTSCSPTKSRQAQQEWAKSEGLMPRSLSFSSTRYSRSRTPPCAASSKYNVRNRIQSSPMTVISEGDVEAVEPAESRTHRSLEEDQLDVFDNEEMDINEDVGSNENCTTQPDLITD